MKSWIVIPSSLLLLAALMLGGCSNLQKIAKAQQPKASVTGTSVAGMSLQDITLNVRVKIDNPNPFRLQGVGLTLNLLIDNNKLVTVSQPDASLSVPAKGSQEVVLPVRLRYQDIYRTARHLADKNEIAYRLEGKVSIEVPVLGAVSIPVSHTDTLPVPRLPDISLKGIKLVKSSFTSLQLQVDLGIKNPNRFGLNLNGLGFKVAANDKTLSSASAKPVNVAAAGEQTLSVPITLNITELGSSLFSLLSGGKSVQFGVEGKADVVPELDAWKPDAMEFKSGKRLNL